MGTCDCGKETVWNDMCSECLDKYEDELDHYRGSCVTIKDDKVVEKKYNIEMMYKVWDHVNGGNLVIQSSVDEGTYFIGSQEVTIEQIPGIIEVLQKIMEQ